MKSTGGPFLLALDQIIVDPKNNARAEKSYAEGSDEPGQESSSLERLGESMSKLGQLQNCGVKKTPRGWVLVFGFRRYAAARKIDMKHLRVIDIDDPAAQLAENIGGKKLRPVEIAVELHRLRTSEKLTEREIVARTGMSRQSVGNYLLVMREIHDQILELWKKTPGAFQVAQLVEVAKLSNEKQLEWCRNMLGALVPQTKTEREPQRRKRITVRDLRKQLETGKLPEIDRLTPRDAALKVLNMLGAMK